MVEVQVWVYQAEWRVGGLHLCMCMCLFVCVSGCVCACMPVCISVHCRLTSSKCAHSNKRQQGN